MADAEWKGDEFADGLRRDVAQRLILQAITLESEEKRNVSRSFPPASKEDEYPKFRTGTGREATTYRPTSVDEVMAKGYVEVGVSAAGKHMAILEIVFRRKGFRATLAAIADKLRAIWSGGGK